jgi:DNA-binding CsgD family transcriptional regulator
VGGPSNGVGTEGLTEDFTPRHGGPWPLLERDVELGELDALVANARGGRGRLALIEGAAGIGKTRLLEEARRRARAGQVTVLSARGGELEGDFPYGIVRQLLEPVVVRAEPASRDQLLAGAARLSEPIFAAEPGDAGAADPTHAVLHGLYWLLANLSERSPLLVGIDDVHWADEPSLRFLIHLARRIAGLPVVVVMATRTDGQAASPELWPALMLEVSSPILRPKPFSEEAVCGVVRNVLGKGAGTTLCRACHEATGGNPFLLSELLEELRRNGHPAPELKPDVVARLAPERVRASLLLRIGRTSPNAPAFARAVAVLGARATVPHAAQLAGLEPSQARLLAVQLARAAVLDQGEPLRFRHPILRSAIYEDISQEGRDALHGRAARMLAEEGASPEEIAPHLLAIPAGGQEWVGTTLEEAGRTALARGAPETAARYLRRALDDSPDERGRGRMLLDLGTAESLVGDPAAVQHLRRAALQPDSPEQRALAGMRLAGALVLLTPDGAVEATEILGRQAEEIGDTHPGLAARLAAHAVTLARMGFGARKRTRKLARLLVDRIAAGSDDPAVLAAVAGDMATTGDPAQRTAELAERALTAMGRARFTMSDWSGQTAIRALVASERFRTARLALNAALGEARARGDLIAVGVLADHLAELLWQLGEVPEAEAEARSGHAVWAEQGWLVGKAGLAGRLIDILLERGEVAAAARLVEGSLAVPADALPGGFTFSLLLSGRGRLRLIQGRPDEALVDLLECGRRLTELGELSPAVVSWRRNATLAFLSLGDVGEARRLADEELTLARRHGGFRAQGVALRVAGLVKGGEGGIELLGQAVSELERSDARLDHARALVDLGSALRRAGHPGDARERLAEGMDMAHRCGGRALVESAHEELNLAGARPRRVALTGIDALTPGERRVARMAAEGMTNKEIAQSLFVTMRTIEMHLSNAYRKLEISSRQELPIAFGHA